MYTIDGLRVGAGVHAVRRLGLGGISERESRHRHRKRYLPLLTAIELGEAAIEIPAGRSARPNWKHHCQLSTRACLFPAPPARTVTRLLPSPRPLAAMTHVHSSIVLALLVARVASSPSP
ncbi:hypothetical protein AcV5_009870 [Taiwanofungus camphoratus]|nr:hypothetical protein AcV5_009870 [Antrodia cinnamomea]